MDAAASALLKLSTAQVQSAGWRDPARVAPLRKRVVNQIYRELFTRKPPNANLARLQGLAKYLECRLYYLATSEAKYADETTLVKRLGAVVHTDARMRKVPMF